MKAELSTSVAVQRFMAFAEMAWLEERPELGLLCGEARKSGRLDEALVRRVLPEVSLAAARNLLRWCQKLDLCNAGGALTTLGEAAAESPHLCPVPEQGVYELWTATHPLFGGTRILHAERRRSSRDGRFEETEILADVPMRGVAFRSVLDPETAVVLRDLPRMDGGPARGKLLSTSARAEIRWSMDFAAGTNTFRVEGALDGMANAGDRPQPRGMKMTPESVPLDLERLFAEWARQYLPGTLWDPQAERLLVSFADLTEDVQESFCASFPLENIDVPGRGAFKKAALRDVPLGPRTPADAQRWADARLDRRLADKPPYRSRADVRELFAKVVRSTPLAEHRPRLASHSDLLMRHTGSAEASWSLVAPVDLAPAPVGEALLGALSFSDEGASS